MIGAKVDKRIVPIDYKVKTGEIIEILTTKEVGHGPSRDWLKIVKTSEARNKIRQWFKKERREENIVEGRSELEREFRRNNVELSDEILQSLMDTVGKRNSCNSLEDLNAAIGYGGIQLWKIMPRNREEYNKSRKAAQQAQEASQQATQPQPQQPPKNKTAAGGVLVEGVDNCLIKFSKCCNPLPGDDIIGFITRGFGVSIHKRNCTNVPARIEDAAEPERWVRAYWAGEVREKFQSTLEIVADDRSGLLADVTQQLFAMHLFIHSLNSRELKDGSALISATFTVNGLDHLQSVMDRIKGVEGVRSVKRA